jgi:CubicO group peptidase (beta-lactamase class C family)
MRKSLGAMLLLIGVVAVSVASAQSLPSADPGEVGISTDRLQRIADALNRDIEDGQLPGAVVAVARNGLVVYFEAFGFLDKEAGIPMPKDAIFRIYSMTKPLTTVAAMILVEQGRLQLTDPVSKFFPTFSNLKVSIPKTDASGNASYELVSAKREMTVHDLLRHTAGLAYGGITKNAAVRDAYIEAGLYARGESLAERDMSAAEQIERFSRLPLIH